MMHASSLHCKPTCHTVTDLQVMLHKKFCCHSLKSVFLSCCRDMQMTDSKACYQYYSLPFCNMQTNPVSVFPALVSLAWPLVPTLSIPCDRPIKFCIVRIFDRLMDRYKGWSCKDVLVRCCVCAETCWLLLNL